MFLLQALRGKCHSLYSVAVKFFEIGPIKQTNKQLYNNSDDHRILQELYDNRILVKFVLGLFRIIQEIDDHGIIVKIFIEFDQNSVSQP